MAYIHPSVLKKKAEDNNTTAPSAGDTSPKVPEAVKKIQELASPDNFFAGALVKSLVILATLIMAPLALEYFTGSQNITSSPWYWLAMIAVAIVYGVRWLEKKTSMEPFVVIGKIIIYVSLAFLILNTAWDVFVASRPDFKDKKMNLKHFLEFVNTGDDDNQTKTVKKAVVKDVDYYPPRENAYPFNMKKGDVTDHYIHATAGFEIFSDNFKYELIPRSGNPIRVWAGEKMPYNIGEFKIKAVEDTFVGIKVGI